MESPFKGAVLDPVKCSELSMEERREIVYEIANWSHGAPEMLQSWSRQDILRVLCSEMGKERKYTGLTKLKIIEHLLKVVSKKKSGNNKSGGSELQSSPSVIHKTLKRPRKSDHPTRLLIATTDISRMSNEVDSGTSVYCKNSACKARLSTEDSFCQRCSCCICFKYDDNKDPSLWLTCCSEPPFQGDSCNMSWHVECALKHGKSGLARNGLVPLLDGSFYCVSCWKINDLMSFWRKQVMIAKNTRRVDILCYRLSLSQKLLSGTKKFRGLSEIMDDAVKLLETEVGTLTCDSAKMISRGIVNRLSSGQEVQKLCASAVASFDSMVCSMPLNQESEMTAPPNVIKVEQISQTTVTVILAPDTLLENNVSYTLWHHKAVEKKTAKPTCTFVPSKTRFTVSDLSPATEYVIRVASIINSQEISSSEVRVTTTMSVDNIDQSPQTNCSSLSNPSSVEDETNTITPSLDLNHSSECDAKKFRMEDTTDIQIGEAISTRNLPNSSRKNDRITSLSITSLRVESLKSRSKDQDKVDEECLKSSIEIRNSEIREECVGDECSEGNLEHYIKVIRWLECRGHIDKVFRQKFLTWYSIRATPEETRVVRAFVDTLIDDPSSLAEQIVDTFEEIVSRKNLSVAHPGFCLKLWH